MLYSYDNEKEKYNIFPATAVCEFLMKFHTINSISK